MTSAINFRQLVARLQVLLSGLSVAWNYAFAPVESWLRNFASWSEYIGEECRLPARGGRQ